MLSDCFDRTIYRFPITYFSLAQFDLYHLFRLLLAELLETSYQLYRSFSPTNFVEFTWLTTSLTNYIGHLSFNLLDCELTTFLPHMLSVSSMTCHFLTYSLTLLYQFFRQFCSTPFLFQGSRLVFSISTPLRQFLTDILVPSAFYC